MDAEQTSKPIRLYDLASGECIGEITEGQPNAFIEAFEEEHLQDRNYYVHRVTLSSSKMPSPVGEGTRGREEMNIRWERAREDVSPNAPSTSSETT